jgi:hypothetical protein
MLAAARKDLGLVGRPNRITRDYASRHGDEFLDAAWCDMSVTWWSRRSGNAAAVLPEGDRALTIWHAEDGQRLGLWYPGTAANIKTHAKPGAVLFMDWGGSDIIGRIDHVGIVEVNLGDGRVQSIEGNTGNACKRRVRGPDVIAGFWNPDYSRDVTVDTPAKNWTEELVDKLPDLAEGAGRDDKDPVRWHVKTLTGLLYARGYPVPEGTKETEFTPAHTDRVRAIQAAAGIKPATGKVTRTEWAKLLKV